MTALAPRLLLCLALALPLAAQQLASGFVDEVVATGFTKPVGMSFLPDGRILVIESHSGRIHVVAGAASQVAATIPNVGSLHLEQGLLGIAVDPQWPQWPYVYCAYSHTAPASMRLVRLTASGDLSNAASTNLSLGAQLTLLDDAPDQSVFHNGGTLRFGPDGMLYMSLGDDSNDCDAQDPNVLAGKILRLDVSGLRGSTTAPSSHAALAAAGNPFSGANGQLVWALGFRNPFRFAVDDQTGLLYVGDVGASSWEELDEVAMGDNLGWPGFEGLAPFSGCPLPPTGAVDPIAVHPNPGGASIIAWTAPYQAAPGALFDFGPAYAGSLFYGDFYRGFLRRLVPDGNGGWNPAPAVPGQPTSSDWGDGYTLVSDSAIGPDGALYYVRFTPGSVRRIRPDAANRQLAIISGTPQTGNASWPVFEPLVVRVSDLQGNPLAGIPVNFSVVAGGGTLDAQPVLSDGQGLASTGFQLPEATASNPVVIRASVPGAPPVDFSITWRGLDVDFDPVGGSLVVTVRHSQMSSPVTLLGGIPAPAPAITNWGLLGLDLLDPGSHLLVADGLGLLGPADPLFQTHSFFPTMGFGIGGIPALGGFEVALQAYALDTALLPQDSAVLVSNVVTLILP